MNCIVPCKAGSFFDLLAGWSHTLALLYCRIAVRLLGEMRLIDLLLSHTITMTICFTCHVCTSTWSVWQREFHLPSQVRTSEWRRMILTIDSRPTKARKQEDYSRMFVDSEQ